MTYKLFNNSLTFQLCDLCNDTVQFYDDRYKQLDFIIVEEANNSLTHRYKILKEYGESPFANAVYKEQYFITEMMTRKVEIIKNSLFMDISNEKALEHIGETSIWDVLDLIALVDVKKEMILILKNNLDKNHIPVWDMTDFKNEHYPFLMGNRV